LLFYIETFLLPTDDVDVDVEPNRAKRLKDKYWQGPMKSLIDHFRPNVGIN
jgi:hypothetical protein